MRLDYGLPLATYSGDVVGTITDKYTVKLFVMSVVHCTDRELEFENSDGCFGYVYSV
jgi:hypothetical protein